jgi:hypothetical protein
VRGGVDMSLTFISSSLRCERKKTAEAETSAGIAV